jgi:cell division protein FtsW (lipid II flippase)
VSYGGSSLVFSMVGAGLLLNVARQGRVDTRPVRPSPMRSTTAAAR